MGDIINLLPDSVANQIAAGEVIQRPASVVKELVENSIDAGATQIKVIIIGAGRTSIQVIDNGKGMSGTDARMSFERHATSKISSADDLFALQTMGFRGEALASIAAIAHVELKTRREEDELGTLIEIAGSKFEQQKLIQSSKGTSFTIKNLFYNVPARRKFLKSDETEMRNIMQELNRIMLCNPSISFMLFNGDDILYDLLSGTYIQRIVALFGKKTKNITQKLLKVDVQTSLVNITGYVGVPEVAAKNPAQYFFVNGRYMYHPYFRKAVINAFERMLPADMSPMFFLSLEVNPSSIDVNIHPTKTEIKFEDDKAIWSIISASVKEALGKFNITPTIDFDMDNSLNMPVHTDGGENRVLPSSPKISFDPKFNPFSFENNKSEMPTRNWQSVFDGVFSDSDERKNDESSINVVPLEDIIIEENNVGEQSTFDFTEGLVLGEMMQYKNRYLCTTMLSGMIAVDIRRAILRVEYDDLRKRIEKNSNVSQKVLFPEVLELGVDELCLFNEIELDLQLLGFEFRAIGKYLYSVEGIPAQLSQDADVLSILNNMIESVKENGAGLKEEMMGVIILSLAQSISFGGLSFCNTREERESLLGRLFQSSNPNYTPDGKKIVVKIDLEDMFN